MDVSTHEPLPADQQLITRAQSGEQAAFRALVDRHHRFAYAISVRLLHDPDEASDIVQDAFVRVWKNLPDFRSGHKFTTWLYRIVVNLCYDRIKMNKRRRKVFDAPADGQEEEPRAGEHTPEREAELQDYRAHILAAARALPPVERIVFHLRDLQDLSVEEVAGIVGISAGSVKTNLCYARKKIREALLSLEGQ